MSADDIKWAWTDTLHVVADGLRRASVRAGLCRACGFCLGRRAMGRPTRGLFPICRLRALPAPMSAANAQIYFSNRAMALGWAPRRSFIGGGAVSMTSMHTG